MRRTACRTRPLQLLLAALLLLGTQLAGAGDLAPLLARIREAYGGESPPTSILQRGRTISRAQGEGKMLRAYRGPDTFRVEIHYSSGDETRIVAGERAWLHNRPMSDAFRGALLLQAARVALPWNLLAAPESLRDGGEHPFGKKRLRYVELPLADGLTLIAEVDPDNGHILRSRGVLQHASSQMVFGTMYEDFRRADGRLYAAVEHHFAMNRYIGRSYIDSIEFGATLPDSLFRPAIPGLI